MDLSPAEIPQRLIQQLFELDADYVEALWALDQPRRSLDWHAMLRETLASLEQLPATRTQFRKYLPRRAHPTLESLEDLHPEELGPWGGIQHGAWKRPQKQLSTPSSPIITSPSPLTCLGAEAYTALWHCKARESQVAFGPRRQLQAAG
jgi:hypothetical protein